MTENKTTCITFTPRERALILETINGVMGMAKVEPSQRLDLLSAILWATSQSNLMPEENIEKWLSVVADYDAERAPRMNPKSEFDRGEH